MARVILQIVALLTDNSGGNTDNHNMLIVQVTDLNNKIILCLVLSYASVRPAGAML
jgi:hypothetical protein